MTNGIRLVILCDVFEHDSTELSVILGQTRSVKPCLLGDGNKFFSNYESNFMDEIKFSYRHMGLWLLNKEVQPTINTAKTK